MHRWRTAGWTSAALLLLVPLVAMRFTDEVNWNSADFALAAVLIGGTGLGFELLARKSSNRLYQAAIGLALVTGLLLVWINAAVGIIGSEDHPANLMFGAVLAVGIIGSVIAGFRATGLAYALLATALTQLIVALVALAFGLGRPHNGTMEILGVTGVFVGLWLISAWLFRKAARG